jgi:hypothetical protein
MEFDMTTNAIGYIPTYVLQNDFYVDNDKQRDQLKFHKETTSYWKAVHKVAYLYIC